MSAYALPRQTPSIRDLRSRAHQLVRSEHILGRYIRIKNAIQRVCHCSGCMPRFGALRRVGRY